MDNEIYNNLKEHHSYIDSYINELQITNQFFKSRIKNKEVLDEVFWNHILSLFRRIDVHEQNDMESYEIEEVTEEAKKLLREYIEEISKHRDFAITEFEGMLLTIYTQRMLQEE